MQHSCSSALSLELPFKKTSSCSGSVCSLTNVFLLPGLLLLMTLKVFSSLLWTWSQPNLHNYLCKQAARGHQAIDGRITGIWTDVAKARWQPDLLETSTKKVLGTKWHCPPNSPLTTPIFSRKRLQKPDLCPSTPVKNEDQNRGKGHLLPWPIATMKHRLQPHLKQAQHVFFRLQSLRGGQFSYQLSSPPQPGRDPRKSFLPFLSGSFLCWVSQLWNETKAERSMAQDLFNGQRMEKREQSSQINFSPSGVSVHHFIGSKQWRGGIFMVIWRTGRFLLVIGVPPLSFSYFVWCFLTWLQEGVSFTVLVCYNEHIISCGVYVRLAQVAILFSTSCNCFWFYVSAIFFFLRLWFPVS